MLVDVTKEAEIISEKNESWTGNCKTRQQQHESTHYVKNINKEKLLFEKKVLKRVPFDL